jgi:Gluconate 2-dehydrogenase subunit 3
MPPMRQAWRQGIKAIDEKARARCGGSFRELPHNQQDAVLAGDPAQRHP